MATQLTTLDRVKRYCKLAPDATSEDEQLTDLLNGASEEIRQYCRQDFDLSLFEEVYHGSGNRWLQLSQAPVRNVLSVSVRGQSMTESDGYGPGYLVEDRALYNNLGYWPPLPSSIAVAYTAGYDVVPEDIQQSCVYLVSLRYKKREHLGMTSRSNGAASDSYDTIDMPQSIKDVLDKYIEPDLVLPARSKKTAPPVSAGAATND